LTIDGNNSTITRTGPDFRFFEVGTFGSLTLNDLTLTNGRATAGKQSVIYSSGRLSLNRVSIQQHFGSAIYAGGGALGSLTVTDSVFADPISYGNAIENHTTTSITNSTFTNLRDSRGGAIYSSGTLVIDGSTFSNNTASNQGGAIYSISPLTIINSRFENNSAEDSGGAVHSAAQSTSVTNSIFTGNSVTDMQFGTGGALDAHPSGNINISYSCIVGNSVHDGAAVVHRGNCSITAQNNWWGAYDGPAGAGTGEIGRA